MAAVIRSRWFGMLVAAALAVSGVVLSVPAAGAASVDVTCAGTETVTYDPGLLVTPQTVHVTVTAILAPCSSSDSSITAGNYVESFNATLSCSTIFSGRAGTRVFNWSNGQTTTFAFNRALNDAGGQTTVTFTGYITSGEFHGDTAVEQVAFATPSTLQCLAPPGLTSLGPGPAVVNITHP
ncbi:MAG TPA: hypothetical protein VF942_00045 [Acidimicrobiales bacterium]